MPLASPLALGLGAGIGYRFSAAAYGRMLRGLLPPARWKLVPGGILYEVLEAAAEELARVDGRGIDLLAESDPRRSSDLLPDFEEMLELASSGTFAERRARVVALLIRRQRVRPVDYQQALAGLLGQAPVDVVVIETSRADAIAMQDNTAIYRFFIFRDPAEPGSYDLAAAQDLVDRMAHSHTRGYVIESDNFLCDDPYSLCDRDILGV
jgi:uncharacterized protein YmfQ (DUF2313 family)